MPEHMTRKAVPQIYDADTAIGTNNSGILTFSYDLEDTDQTDAVITGSGTAGQADVFNGQKSVLWNNLRDCFRGDISNLYKTLRSDGTWSYDVFVNLFEDHQAVWPEAVWNEDAWFKYVRPFIQAITKDEETGQLIKTDQFLPMLQGPKKQQRKYWLQNRFRYMDSKYITGQAATRFIEMRLFNSGILNITTAISLYVSVRFGRGTTPVQVRCLTPGTPVQIEYDKESHPGVQEMETTIYSADLITDVGDLSGFYPNELDFKYCTRLRNLKVGDGSASYSNGNLTKIDVKNCVALEVLDLRNAPNLTQSINLDSCPRFKEGYFEGTSITGISLASGAPTTTLHLPDTTTSIVLSDNNKLSDFQLSTFENVTLLYLENIDQDIIDPLVALRQMKEHSWINITGLYLDFDTKADIDEFLALVATMDGVVRSLNDDGEWQYVHVSNPVVGGTIHTDTLTGAEISAYRTNYPYLTFRADNVTCVLTYASYDGSTVIDTETVTNYGDGTKSLSPTRASTSKYVYTHVGWALTPSSSIEPNASSADPNATKHVDSDRTVYAAYSGTLQKYTATFVNTNGNTTLYTQQNVPYGTTPTYAGPATSSLKDADNNAFESWTPALGPITGNTTYKTKYASPVEEVLLTDTWADVAAHLDAGDYASVYKLGNMISIDLGAEGTTHRAQIVEINTAEGYIEFLLKDLLNTSHRMNPYREGSEGNYTVGTGAIGGWEHSEMRSWLNSYVKPLLPEIVRNRLVTATKTQPSYNSAGTSETQTTADELFIPSLAEMTNTYKKIFPNDNSRKKYKLGSSSATWYWERSAYATNDFYYVTTYGGADYVFAGSRGGVALGFRISSQITQSAPTGAVEMG